MLLGLRVLGSRVLWLGFRVEGIGPDFWVDGDGFRVRIKGPSTQSGYVKGGL